jgi:hypothetical protein
MASVDANQGSVQLQDLVDEISRQDELLSLKLSVTVADPLQEDCPLIACSDGFTELTGYSISEIVGRNCRFLLNGVPEEFIDEETRLKCRDYVARTRGAPEDPTSDQVMTEFLKTRPWMSTRPGEIICVQTNATKSGELFKNMFYMKQVELNEKPFILGLQARLPEEWRSMLEVGQLEGMCEQAFAQLGKNMRNVEEVLSRNFWYSAAARRQDQIKTVRPSFAIQAGVGLATVMRKGAIKGFPFAKEDELEVDDSAKWTHRQLSESTAVSGDQDIDIDDQASFGRDSSWARQSTGDASADKHARAPSELHLAFDVSTVQSWNAGRFETLGKIEDASRNHGSVCLMKDSEQGSLVAVKQMPNEWVCDSYDTFCKAHPEETEHPWNDIGCNRFLNSIGYPYAAQLLGVFRGDVRTFVVSEFVNGGDLFSWAADLKEQPGPEREAVIKPLIKQLMHATQCLHNLSIAHGDLSLENVLLSSRNGTLQVKLIDFGAASPQQAGKGRLTGKPSYQAPEMFDTTKETDLFLCDAFSAGVVLYAAALMDYPWMSTEEKGDKCFAYVKSKGFDSFLKKRKLPNTRTSVHDVLSPELRSLLCGLLDVNPDTRLTLGEDVYGSTRKSVWDEPFLQ